MRGAAIHAKQHKSSFAAAGKLRRMRGRWKSNLVARRRCEQPVWRSAELVRNFRAGLQVFLQSGAPLASPGCVQLVLAARRIVRHVRLGSAAHSVQQLAAAHGDARDAGA